MPRQEYLQDAVHTPYSACRLSHGPTSTKMMPLRTKEQEYAAVVDGDMSRRPTVPHRGPDSASSDADQGWDDDQHEVVTRSWAGTWTVSCLEAPLTTKNPFRAKLYLLYVRYHHRMALSLHVNTSPPRLATGHAPGSQRFSFCAQPQNRNRRKKEGV